MLQAVPKDRRFSITVLYESTNRVKTIQLNKDGNWETEHFYVSQFYSLIRAEYPVHDISAFS